MKYFFKNRGQKLFVEKLHPKPHSYLLCVSVCVEREGSGRLLFLNGFWFGKKRFFLSLTTRYRRLSHRLRHIRVKSFFFFGLHPYSTIPPLPQKTDISPLPPSLNFFEKTKYKKLIVHPSQTIPPSSLSLLLFLKIVTKYLEKQKQAKLICVCVLCCVRCGRSETFFVLNGIKTDLTTTKKNIQVFAFFGSMFSLLFCFFFLNFPPVEEQKFSDSCFHPSPVSHVVCVCVGYWKYGANRLSATSDTFFFF